MTYIVEHGSPIVVIFYFNFYYLCLVLDETVSVLWDDYEIMLRLDAGDSKNTTIREALLDKPSGVAPNII